MRGGEGGGEPGRARQDAARQLARGHGQGLRAGAGAAAAATPARGAAATLQDFRETGRLGCPDCYRSFEAPLRDLLRRLHGSTHHLGERYAERGAEPAAAERGSEQAADLREQLRLAVETENFELAAELRDRLRVLE